MHRGATLAALLATLPTTTACAWQNPANRQAWQAFEANLVPEDKFAFAVTLPLTLPAVLLAVLLDTFVLHPVAVLDDAAGDTSELWQELDWQNSYYSELAVTPARVAWTPVYFALDWLGRSTFDIEPRGQGNEESHDAQDGTPGEADDAEAAEARFLVWLADVTAGRTLARFSGPGPSRWDDSLRSAVQDSLDRASALARLTVYRSMRQLEASPAVLDPLAGLRDRDPVVRYLELLALPRNLVLPSDLRSALQRDPSESVRQTIQARDIR